MFDYDVNIRKIHEICNKIYKKDRLRKTIKQRPFVQVCPLIVTILFLIHSTPIHPLQSILGLP